MFPSTPFPFDTTPKHHQSTTTQIPPPFSLLHFPAAPPSLEEQELFVLHQYHPQDLILQDHETPMCKYNNTNGILELEGWKKYKSNINSGSDEVEMGGGVVVKKSSGGSGCKRDRHSKIKTARGLRDRRMRLSLQVAKRFFGLQDMLGFDKASKTVEWLLNHSKHDINQLAIHHDHQGRSVMTNTITASNSTNNSDQCEGVSSLDEVAFVSTSHEQVKRSGRGSSSRKRNSSSSSSAQVLHPIIGRESRQKARERARERTKEKEKIKSHKLMLLQPPANPMTTTNELTQFGCWNPFESGGGSQESAGKVSSPSLDVMLQSQQQAKDDDVEDSLVINIGKWSPSSMIFTSFNNSPFIPQELHQFAEFQSLAKLWEACNNHMI